VLANVLRLEETRSSTYPSTLESADKWALEPPSSGARLCFWADFELLVSGEGRQIHALKAGKLKTHL